MQIIREQFQTKIVGKCLTEEDILQLWKFGFSKENIAKKYARDNKIKSDESKQTVMKILYEEVQNDIRKNNTRCKSK